MKKHLYFIMFLTFVTGLSVGVYGYMSTHTGDGVRDAVPEPALETTGYEVLATVYGGCARLGCSSYHLTESGAYRYLAPDGRGGYYRYEDEISPKQREALAVELMHAPLARIAASSFTGTCPVTYDGIAYRFEIRRETERFSFDTCAQSLDGVELFVELVKYFDIMEATHRTP